MRPRRLSRAPLIAFLAMLASTACTTTANRTTPTPTGLPTASPTLLPTPAPSGGALIAALPDGCAEAAPSTSATVAFVADGNDILRAWAVSPDGTGLTCLFELGDPGPFQWGPRADRVVVGGLQVLGVGSGAARPAGSVEAGPLS